MHILVVNDDGPPSTHSSPYVHSLVRDLQAAGHLVSVCLPHTQRSWIGKAHIIGQTVEPVYYRPPPPDAPPAGLHRRDDEPDNEGSLHTRPHRPAETGTAAGDHPPEEWVLVNGTPASCVQIGLFHVFKDRPPVDLVVSGPNYGRNTTAVFALSSGTLGGALEAATCGRTPAIALSYAFFSKNHDRAVIAEASRHAVRVIEALWRQWPRDGSVDLYSVNIPLVAGVASHKTVYAAMLQNYWREGGCFAAVAAPNAEDAGDAEEERIREGAKGEVAAEKGAAEQHVHESAPAPSTAQPPAAALQPSSNKPTPASHHGHTAPLAHQHFKWQPHFADVYKSVEEAPPGNDGWAVSQGMTSITPLKANFWQAATELHETEFQLDKPADDHQVGALIAGLSISEHPADKAAEATTKSETAASAPPAAETEKLYALVAYEDPYVQPIILDALRALVPPDRLQLLAAPPGATAATAEEPVSLAKLLEDAGVVAGDSEDGSSQAPRVLQITPYEVIDFEYATRHPATTLVNSYCIRKALIRKHFLAGTVELWAAKRPQSVLRGHVPRAEAFEVDYAEFLDDALVEAFDLRASLEWNEEEGKGPAEREWWILKPSMSDRGQGIRLFSTLGELQAIFDGWEEDFEEEDDDDDDEGENEKENDDDGDNDAPKDYIAASHLRHFVAQPYIHPPLLLPGTAGRKFHVRVYVLCVGAMQVYVYRDMLALFAAVPYAPPWAASAAAEDGADEEDGFGPIDLAAHLTNTCLQDEADKGDAVRRFWDLAEPEESSSTTGDYPSSSPSVKDQIFDQIFDQICRVTGELFEAAAVAAPVHFQPLAHAFEVYGLDFLVQAAAGPERAEAGDGDPQHRSSVTAWLLEANAFPDFRQTGSALQGVVAQFWADALRLVVGRVHGGSGRGGGAGGGGKDVDDLGQMVLVKDLDLGRR